MKLDRVDGVCTGGEGSCAAGEFDNPIPVDVEVKGQDQDLSRLKREIEDKVRDILTVRIEPNLVPPGTIERTQYKTVLVRVRNK